MSKRQKLIDKVNAARARLGLGETDAGFNYAMAIQQIMKKRKCTQAAIGARIGCTGRQVGNFLNDTQLPNHVSAEFLFGLWKDTFPNRDPRDPKYGLVTQKQKAGGAPDLPPKSKRLRE